MKQIKKILCGVMLTSFVILGSVNVLANGLGDNDDGGDGGGTEPPSCQEMIEMVSKEEVKNSEYTEEVVVGDMNASAGMDFLFDPPPTPQPVPPGEEPPKITYVTIHNETSEMTGYLKDGTAYDCDDEYTVCSIEAPSDPEAINALQSGLPDTVKTVKQNYNFCQSVDIEVSYKYTYYYKDTESSSCDCNPAPCGDSCALEHDHIECPGHEREVTREGTIDKTISYTDVTGRYLAGKSEYSSYPYDDEIDGAPDPTEYDSESEAKAALEAYAEQNADTYLPQIYSKLREASKHEVSVASWWSTMGPETGTFDAYHYYLQYGVSQEEAQANCAYYVRREITGMICQSLINEGFYNLADNTHNTTIINGCRRYTINRATWDGSSNYSYGNQKLNRYYKYNDLFLQENNRYGVLFPVTSLMKNQRDNTALGINTWGVMWDSSWNPSEIEFREKTVYAEATGKYRDKQIRRDNASVDLFIQNLTNPDSIYKNATYFPLNATTGYTSFSAIRASINGVPNTLVYPYNDGSGFGFRINLGESIQYTADRQDIYGKNLITGYGYADIYTQRTFQISEIKNIFAYSVGENVIFNEGDFIGLEAKSNKDNVDDSCNYKWRALFNVYGEDGEVPSRYQDSTKFGMDPVYTLTNEGIYYTSDYSTGKILKSSGIMSYKFESGDSKKIYLSVQELVENKFGTIESAFADVTRMQASLPKLYDSKGNIRNAIFTDSDTAGTIVFEDGKNVVNYRNVPDYVNPILSNGTTSLDRYSINTNGIYLKAQSILPEMYSGVVEVPYNTVTSGYTTTETRIVRYYICVGQHNCDCEDINVLCECQDEIAGCPKPDECEENPHLPECQPGVDCTETPNAPECGCFDGTNGNPGNPCNCPDTMDKEDCDLWIPVDEFDPECIDTPEKACDEDPPGGITGKGSEEYFDRFYKPSSTITN